MPPRPLSILPLLLATLLGACARSFPATVPTTWAASPDAQPAVPVVIARALREDPPLPGEPAEGWEALEHANESVPATSHETDRAHHAH